MTRELDIKPFANDNVAFKAGGRSHRPRRELLGGPRGTDGAAKGAIRRGETREMEVRGLKETDTRAPLRIVSTSIVTLDGTDP